MYNVFLARDDKDNIVSIYDCIEDVKECKCIFCGNKVKPVRVGGKQDWYFRHENTKECKGADLQSMLLLVVNTIKSSLDNHITLPSITYKFNKKEYVLRDSENIKVNDLVIEGSLIKMTTDTDEFYILVSSTKRKGNVARYIDENKKVLKLCVKMSDFKYAKSYNDMKSLMKGYLSTLTWLAYPQLTEIEAIVKKSGVVFQNNQGLHNIYCPHSNSVINKDTCIDCPYCVYVSNKKVQCVGNLTKSELLQVAPDTVFPPQDINYVGKCSACGSNNTTYIGETVMKYCRNCHYTELVKCPLCDNPLELHTNKARGTTGYGALFIGCTHCSFTLTYKEHNGIFADEFKFTGGIEDIRKNKQIYLDDLIRYREARKRK